MKALKINRAMLASSGNAEGKPAFIIDSGFYRREFYTLDAAKRHADELCAERNWKFAQVKEYFSRAVVYTAKKSTHPQTPSAREGAFGRTPQTRGELT